LIPARSWCARTVALGLLDANRTAVELVSVKLVHDCVCTLYVHHFDEAEAAGLSAVWVANDGGILDFAMLREEVAKLVIPHGACEASDEQVGAWVGLIGIVAAAVVWRCTIAC
jgi:hypothetical protein